MEPRFQGQGNEVAENQFCVSERQMFHLPTRNQGCPPLSEVLRGKQAKQTTSSFLLVLATTFRRRAHKVLSTLRICDGDGKDDAQ